MCSADSVNIHQNIQPENTLPFNFFLLIQNIHLSSAPEQMVEKEFKQKTTLLMQHISIQINIYSI